MTRTDNISWIKEAKRVLIWRWHETDFGQLSLPESVFVSWFCSKPSNPQEFHSANLISTSSIWRRTRDFGVIDSKYLCIPVGPVTWVLNTVWWRGMHYNIRAVVGIDGVGLSLNIVGCVEERLMSLSDRVCSILITLDDHRELPIVAGPLNQTRISWSSPVPTMIVPSNRTLLRPLSTSKANCQR